MYHAEIIDIRESHPMYRYADYSALCANNVYNTASFYIRNLMTGLKKAEAVRTPNEREVIATVMGSIPEINASLLAKYNQKVARINGNQSLTEKERAQKLKALKCVQFGMPDAVHWYAGYNLLDAVFRYTGNKDYRSHHSHLCQNAVSDCCEAWTGYFERLGEPGHGKLNIPGYRKSGGRSTATFTSIACTIKNGRLFFPGVVLPGDTEKTRPSLDVSRLPHGGRDKLSEVRIVPYFGFYQVQVITDDGLKETDILPKEEDIIGADGTPKGVAILDPGLNNFATITDNRGHAPFIIKGGALKARNQWFNKRMALLKSIQMKGRNPKTFRPVTTKQMCALSRKRDAFIRDTFYKTAHCICRELSARGISYLIAGHNQGQKQGMGLGHQTNQAFVQLPFARFNGILAVVAVKYGIRVIITEESYTSKACFAARDTIPTYGAEGADKAVFSGKRVKRGLYRQNDGLTMNADVNGGANIGRKYDERIFPKGMDTRYLYKTVVSVTYADVLEISRLRKKTG